MFPVVEPIGAGTDNAAWLLNGDVVVRFRRDAREAGRVAAEARLLEFVAGVSPLPVPRPVFVDARRGCLAYRWLPGVPLLSVAAGAGAGVERRFGDSSGGPLSVASGAGVERRFAESPGVSLLPVASRVGVARRLGELLGVLHSVPLERVEDLVEVDGTPPAEWLAEAAGFWPAVADHVPVAGRAAVEAFLAREAPAPAARLVFSHQDLGIEHVLVDPRTGELTGVIDWSDAAVGDPARDFGLILRDLGPDALEAALPAPVDAALRDRATFYARCGLLADLAYAVETGRREYGTKSIAALPWLFSQ